MRIEETTQKRRRSPAALFLVRVMVRRRDGSWLLLRQKHLTMTRRTFNSSVFRRGWLGSP